MKFPNAAKGVKKIFTAEVLMLIGLLAIFVAGIFALITLSASAEESAVGDFTAIGSMVFLLVSFVLLIVAFILSIIGMVNASHDESSFKSALIFFIVCFVLSTVSSLLGNVSMVAGGILSLIGSVVDIFVTIFIIAGIVRLADRLNRGDISVKGSKVLKLLVVIKVVVLIATAVAGFMSGFSVSSISFVTSLVAPSEGGSSPSIAVGIILIVSQVLGLVQYFIYLPFLSQAKKMLNKA